MDSLTAVQYSGEVIHPRRYVWPCLLLLLAEAPSHGYDLVEQLRPLGFEISDPPNVYKSLHRMAQAGLVSSAWQTSCQGPARRIYSLTPNGRQLLDSWAALLAQEREILDQFLGRHRQLPPPGGPSADSPSGDGRTVGTADSAAGI